MEQISVQPICTLSDIRIINFILSKFEKGAKCFNGDWWGGTTESVDGSAYGYDVHVYLKESHDHAYYAIAYAYKDAERSIDLDCILVNEFHLGFWLSVTQNSNGVWGYTIFNSNNEVIEEKFVYLAEHKAHYMAVESFKKLKETNCPLLFNGENHV